MECLICCNETNCLEQYCGHSACRDCLAQWLQRCEENGRQATCFLCSRSMPDEQVETILGRELRPIRIRKPAEDMDDLTLDWVRENGVKQCPWCGIWVEKMSGCDHITCRCQKEFCFGCGLQIGTADDENRCRCVLDDDDDDDDDWDLRFWLEFSIERERERRQEEERERLREEARVRFQEETREWWWGERERRWGERERRQEKERERGKRLDRRERRRSYILKNRITNNGLQRPSRRQKQRIRL